MDRKTRERFDSIERRLKKLEIDSGEVIAEKGKSTIRVDPEIIGDYMRWVGDDYYRMPKKDYSCSFRKTPEIDKNAGILWYGNSGWKNIKDIKITDEIAELRPWVKDMSDDNVFIFYGMVDNGCVNYYYAILYSRKSGAIYKHPVAKLLIATIADLKKAGISE